MAKFIDNWFKNNVYGYKKHDGLMYLFFNIVIPVIITGLSLRYFPDDNIAVIYCFTSILISSFNGFYDISNRWKHKRKSIINTKLFIMAIPIVIIMGYCLYNIIQTLITGKILDLKIGIFYTYFVTVAVATMDIMGCFIRDMALADCVKTHH